MRRKSMKRLSFSISALWLARRACNLPNAQNQGQGAAFTAAAQTVAAQLTGAAQTPGAPGTATNTLAANQPTATSTLTPSPSTTPLPATNTPLPCNLASFVNDVTYPDDT